MRHSLLLILVYWTASHPRFCPSPRSRIPLKIPAGSKLCWKQASKPPRWKQVHGSKLSGRVASLKRQYVLHFAPNFMHYSDILKTEATLTGAVNRWWILWTRV